MCQRRLRSARVAQAGWDLIGENRLENRRTHLPISGNMLGWSSSDLRLFSTRVGEERSLSLISRTAPRSLQSAHLGPTAAHTRGHTRWHTPRTSSIDRLERRHGTERSGADRGAARRGAASGRTRRSEPTTMLPCDDQNEKKRSQRYTYARCFLSVFPRDGTRARGRNRSSRVSYVLRCVLCAPRCATERGGPRSKNTDGTVGDRSCVPRRRGASPVRACRTSHHVVTSLPRTISISLKRLYGRARGPVPYTPLSFSLSLFLSVSGRVKINAERWPRAGGALENQSKSGSPRGAISWPTGGPSAVLSLPTPAALITSTRALVPCLPQRYQGLRAQSRPALTPRPRISGGPRPHRGAASR